MQENPEITLSKEEREYLAPIEKRLTGRHTTYPFTLHELLRDWQRFVLNLQAKPQAFEDFSNEVWKRDLIERELRQGAPVGLRKKIDEFLSPCDEIYRSNTSPVSAAWFGTDLEGWWWFRCPASWAWYRDHKTQERAS